jgi:hypothetical protein
MKPLPKKPLPKKAEAKNLKNKSANNLWMFAGFVIKSKTANWKIAVFFYPKNKKISH